MGECIKDHTLADILEKLEDVHKELPRELVEQLNQGIAKDKWEQPIKNEIFHSLKKLQKRIDEQEKESVLKSLDSFVK